MTTQSITLQEILLPTTPEMKECEDLFFREGLSQELPKDRMTPDNCRWSFSIEAGKVAQDGRMQTSAERSATEKNKHSKNGVRNDCELNCLVIPAGHLADLSCYFNMLSAHKWFETTFFERISLELTIQGDAHIDVIGYQLDDFDSLEKVAEFNKRRQKGLKEDSLELKLLATADHVSSDGETLFLPIGHPNTTLVGIVITAKADVRLFGGKWIGEIKNRHIRNVDLCISTTTFQKEEYISRNIASIKKMLAEYPDMAEHFHMIVVDNGQTLDPAIFADEHVSVFGNNNTGGSGGFTRGMIEALKAEKQPTHLLLMDDDVLIITESLRRTYTLLRALRPEYHHHFLSGAMLYLEYKDIQHEDIGFVHRDGFYAPKKSIHSLRTIVDCACNEVEWPDFLYEYAGWWFCCIPFEFISEDNLPIPFFVRVDDVEYSLRNNAKILTLNGICIWHMYFRGKISPSMEFYQVIRNCFIMRAFQPERNDILFFEHCNKLIHELLNTFAYDYADLILDAIEDYLQGPSIIEKPNGVERIKEKAAFNEKLLPMNQVWQGNADFGKEFDQPGLKSLKSIIQRKLVNYSYNGQLHLRSLVSGQIGFTANIFDYDHRMIYMRNSIIAVNPEDASAIIRVRDDNRFAEVLSRKHRLFDLYEDTHEIVDNAYRELFPRLTSLDFWQDYLEIE